ncbi:hypothetical protein LCE31_38330, partial [Streptomyces sp. 8L]|nr:hypothetical protein [Streptomyces sp. 8L]
MSRSADSDPAGNGAGPSRARPGGEPARTEAAARTPSLAEVVGAGGGLPEDAVLWIAAGLAGALGVLHQAGRAHGDLRAGNVLRPRGGPRLTGDAPGRGAGAPVPAADMIALGMLLVAAYAGVSA